ncbi:proline dehydrogenase 2, mitochondrial-like [Mangifera indica]|uniref:proline dehydrogenase 2, mitochondrial-like n=1 Tax=Mangifera indica TaxID=29780 RepID=UPI001CFA7243|nr:proline dehydrogenase 2, mitochondrial-like [Mangifera indica]
MAIRFLQPKLLHNARSFTRPLSSASSSLTSVSPLNFAEKPDPTIEKHDPCSSTLNTHDHQKLFRTISSAKLLRSLLNLNIAAVGPVVDLGLWVMNSRLMDIDISREIITGLVRHTFYEHFCAGESAAEAERCIEKINETGLRGMLFYSVEHTDDKNECDKNLRGFLQTAESAKSLDPSAVSFVVLKVSAICRMSLLKRVSDLLRWQQKDSSFNLPWKLHDFPIFADNSPLYHTLEKPEPLTQEEENELQQSYERIIKLCRACEEGNIPLVVDAEDTAVQPAIDYLTYASALTYNKGDNLIVSNTIQTYLKDAKERLFLATEAARKMGIPMGYKLVRGAYMSSESKIASSLGFESPIHNSIEETHACFNDCASFMLDKIADGSGGVVLATHNVKSGQMAVAKARDLGIDKRNSRVEFAQLYGMSDALSFGLRNAGFKVSKYMPYGPIDTVMPYLLRRAEENRGFLPASSLDRQLMSKELKRRLTASIF